MSETTDPMSEARAFNQDLIDQFRANGGEIVRGMFKGAPLLLLTTTGAKSGQPRTTPLAYTRDGDRLVVIASKGGAPTNPDWYHNLVANPTATVEVGTETFPVRAQIPTGAE
ncbi:MAG TPA: nitroreductase/quinone reductase family protein, partial [Thermomicrobiales bacterium]|nr:nitroreductase/quinone reductase family protein [Thermomicrobiales bacterium]